MAYEASVNGAPAKPISGTRPASCRLDEADRLEDRRQALARLERGERVDVGLGPDRPLDPRPVALDEVEGEAHGLERQQEVGEDDGGIERQAPDRLQRDLGRELGRPAQLEHRVALAQRAVFLHVSARLAHEPDRGGVNRLTPARSQESIVHGVASGAVANESSIAHPGDCRDRRGPLASLTIML